MTSTTATGSREVPEPPAQVWRALAVLEPYCSVCDVSYVLDGPAGAPGIGTTFVCAPGRLEGSPAAGAPRGEIVEWEPSRLVTTRLRLTPETWTTRIELAEGAAGGTRVTITLTHEPTTGSRVVRRLQRGALRRLVQRTVDAELAKVPAHVARAASPS
ncbi:SRPBCC family protein [Blastococcus sp. TF02-8]|uniref:SRPBCC family protein n=1 Tax=Blastococcus sp. TF02-8 TaxID=2250574 RepID=UPI000DE9C734|nr:SRPBCC family protein [Blastococcus sp. TF02-8]RBY93644.1 SRPBCC family protein [Blastococcus sp. TF02-8]